MVYLYNIVGKYYEYMVHLVNSIYCPLALYNRNIVSTWVVAEMVCDWFAILNDQRDLILIHQKFYIRLTCDVYSRNMIATIYYIMKKITYTMQTIGYMIQKDQKDCLMTSSQVPWCFPQFPRNPPWNLIYRGHWAGQIHGLSH